jgi:uncharacterized protein (TIGR03437 family)
MKKLFGYFIVLSAPMWAQQQKSPTINQLPTRQFGHPTLAVPLTQASPNLVEGRELDAPGQIAFDTSASSPILYIADIGNNRVLAYKNSTSINAGKTADLVIGQQDLVSTLTLGPGTSLTTGLSSPTGVAVDSKGAVYVADAGNNRILRFPAPFSQPTGSPVLPDLVIGQKGTNTGLSPNEGGNCAAKTVAFTSGSSPYLVSLAIDANGNLWTTDPVNERVLMYPVANLTAGAVEPVATVVLGQTDFVTCTQAQNLTQLTKTSLAQPSSLAFDSAGNLYVADSGARVLYYAGPTIIQGQAAQRVLGVSPPPTSGQIVYPNQYSLGAVVGNSLVPPNGVFTQGNHLYVADTPSNRIVEYDVPSSWQPETTALPSPPMLNVIGQIGFAVGQQNGGNAQASAFTLAGPYGGAFLGTQMWVSDSGNNRVLAFTATSGGTYVGATVLVGQLDYEYNAPNLIEGKEVFLSGLLGSEAGMVVDLNSSPPHLYVSDPGNNRILCFNDARVVGGNTTATFADRVIGQPDLKTSEINWPLGKALTPTSTGLFNPIGVAVDNNGNLYVADSGNGRLLRFPAPFAQPAGQQATANLVLGQSSFTTFVQNASANSMHSPWGLALFADSASGTPLTGSLAVSDPTYNRVMIFKKPAGGDFQSGQNATVVIGQSSFSAFAAGNTAAAFNYPRGIASDTSDRLYVADSFNNRVLIFNQAAENITSGPTSSFAITGLSTPLGVAVNATTSELWVANTNSGQVWRYPEPNTCELINCAVTAVLFSNAAPLGLAIDGSGNVIVGDSANRVTFYFAQAFIRNVASYNTQPVAPGMLAVLGRYGLPMTIQGANSSTNPWPTTLGDLNVTVNGTKAPIFRTDNVYGAIYFQVPSNAPISGTANFIVTQFSTGAVICVGTFQMSKTNPAFFTANASGIGPVAATLADGSPNTAANPVNRGAVITFYLTGQGVVANSPADGLYVGGNFPTPVFPTLVIGTTIMTDASSGILYSGLGAFAGGWQINATIPMAAVPNSSVRVALSYLNVPSTIQGTNSSDGFSPGPDNTQTSTTIYVGK